MCMPASYDACASIRLTVAAGTCSVMVLCCTKPSVAVTPPADWQLLLGVIAIMIAKPYDFIPSHLLSVEILSVDSVSDQHARCAAGTAVVLCLSLPRHGYLGLHTPQTRPCQPPVVANNV
eukprot:GHUV01020267.1.p1 GENE.GHUV01020267.1~~GHUV01020267.1.p1  ORF type:complete len:120 (+),score=20.26 GHUV01020267.1:19-378(+)